MRIVLVGAPDTGKRKYAEELARYYSNSLTISKEPKDTLSYLFSNPPALGFLSDYRTELLLGSYRATETIMEDDVILVHSPIDSMAYVMSILAMKLDNTGEEDTRFVEALRFFPFFIQDSMKYDLIIKFPYEGIDPMVKILDKNLNFVLDFYKLDYLNSSAIDRIKEKIYEYTQ